jgi:hypothetical protein
LHGLLSKAVDHLQEWCPPELVDSIKPAYVDVCATFGAVQAELNTGTHDDKLPGIGLAGIQMAPKKTGFLKALRDFFNPTKKGQPPFVGALGSATRWGGIIVGSLSKEGSEVIKEFIEVIRGAQEQYAEARESN